MWKNQTKPKDNKLGKNAPKEYIFFQWEKTELRARAYMGSQANCMWHKKRRLVWLNAHSNSHISQWKSDASDSRFEILVSIQPRAFGVIVSNSATWEIISCFLCIVLATLVIFSIISVILVLTVRISNIDVSHTYW